VGSDLDRSTARTDALSTSGLARGRPRRRSCLFHGDALSGARTGACTLASYADGTARLLAQTQNQFVADARIQACFQYRIDNGLHALASLYPAMPRPAADIADATCAMAQLRSYGQLRLATFSAELNRSGIDPRETIRGGG
jgi:hypothetical protein